MSSTTKTHVVARDLCAWHLWCWFKKSSTKERMTQYDSTTVFWKAHKSDLANPWHVCKCIRVFRVRFISAKLSPEQFAGDLWSDISLAIAAASESKDCKIEPFFTVSKRYQPHTNSHHHIYKTYNHPWWSFMNCNQEAHGGHHRDASMLQFHGSAALERSYIAVRGKSYRVPKADGRLNAQLVLEGGQVDL